MMTPVTTVAQVMNAIQTAKTGGKGFCTNFFPAQAKLQGWIDHGELLAEVRGDVAFFARRDRDFWHLYYCTANLTALRSEFGVLSCLRSEPIAIDLVGSEASLQDMAQVMNSAGFRHYRRLIRLGRGSSSDPAPASQDAVRIAYAEERDGQAILELIEGHFDRYADQLPVPYEIQAAIQAQQMLTIKGDGKLAALLFFETQGFTSTIRYWVVAEAFRSQRCGSALMRHYFASQDAVRRFVLWVTAENDNAVTKYRHYGYAPDGLVDHVFVNDLIRA
jgi:ribosomal protein S18 acetylase RimI-like enzyme